MNSVDVSFDSMGGTARVQLESGLHTRAELEQASDRARARLEVVEATLSRFRPDSELSTLNRDPRTVVPASPLMRALVRASRFAGLASGGLVDVTLVDQVEDAGYRATRAGAVPASLDDALAAAPPRRPARARTSGDRSSLSVDPRGCVSRPPGLRIDSGGIGKGMAADIAAAELPAGVSYAISCGGDLAAGGRLWEIVVTSARTGAPVHTVGLRGGGVATSGIHSNLWRRPDGSYAHHLIDPSTGLPAWTGIVAATAVGGSAVDAEVLAKAALLSGPEAGRRLLRRRGGVLQYDDGMVEIVPALMAQRLTVAA
jgi:thiamine biosynthesis lipoprotein